MCLLSLSPVFFNLPATPVIYTLSLHDALPICARVQLVDLPGLVEGAREGAGGGRILLACIRPPPAPSRDRKSTRLNSSHRTISYAVFCLKKKNDRTAFTWYVRLDRPLQSRSDW